MRARLLIAAGAVAAGFAMAPSSAQAVTCPNPVPVVNENNCRGAGATDWRLTNYDANRLAGFATKTSVNRGEDVTLKVARSGGAGTVDLHVYRMGYYGGTGARKVHQGSAVANGSLNCNGTDDDTGYANCNNWDNSYTIPASALPASGVYLVRLVDRATGFDNHVIFTVRDDNRVPESQLLYKLPIATYQAYNGWTGKSLYPQHSPDTDLTITGSPRAVKVSFDRPFEVVFRNANWFMRADYPLVYWLEQQGYDVSYTDNVAVHQNPAELRQHDVLVISGHDEYWSAEELAAYKAARDAGVDIASFSANTAYWKIRYEDGARSIVCYKTVQADQVNGDGRLGVNDWGPDGQQGTADDALGLDQRAGTADDRPQNSSTTFRDNGAPPGDPTAPAGGRVGPDTPENALLGAMYLGDNDNYHYPFAIPPANAQGEFAADRIWRRTGIAAAQGAVINAKQVGWEWDVIPTQAQYAAKQPSGVKRLSETELLNSPPSPPGFLQDEGRVYADTPPPGQPSTTTAVKYTAPSGANVFHSSTIQWSWGLGPHFLDMPGFSTYLDPPVDSSDPRIKQATYNILADADVQPNTPVGITIDGNEPPSASFTIAPNPVQVGQQVTFNGSGSSDLDGTLTNYEWDLDGDGAYETNTGTSPVATRTYASTATLAIRLRVTDDKSSTGESVRTLTIGSGATGPYSNAVLNTPGLVNYWRMGETAGTTFADSKGTAHATTAGVTPGASGALAGDSNKAGAFDGTNDAASAAVDLSATGQLSIEFWLKWNGHADDDDLAMELTSDFNAVNGGFLIDPNAPQEGGKFGVSIGRGASRNNVFFNRPSAGEWHHYVLVLDTGAPANSQITPYVDGQAVGYTKTASGTGAGNFANSSLYFMSRAGSALFGAGSMDEAAIYNRVLDAATVRDHYRKGGGSTASEPPVASFTASPNPTQVGQTVTFNGSASTDPDGQIASFSWDLDGDGSYETNTGTTPTATKSYAGNQTMAVRLWVTDDTAATGDAIRTLKVGTGATSSYAAAVLGTTGLRHYWRLGETTGTSLADLQGSAHATAVGGPALGLPGPIGDSDKAAGFDGLNDAASGQVDLSNTGALTVEFWLKWNGYADDDDLALELTPNFNDSDGGLLIDPNAPQEGGRFGVAIGRGTTRNNVFFTRPSAGAWHHYAFVLNTAAAADQQIVPYVDGQPVTYTKTASGTGAGNFASSSLALMSRNAASLFGAGTLDELAIYDRPLEVAMIQEHFQNGDTVNLPHASFTIAPNPVASGDTVTFDGSGSTDPNGTITRYEWDLDGNGSFETDTATNPRATKSYTAAGPVTVRLRVTDSSAATAEAANTLTVTDRAPSASFTAAPSPAPLGQVVTFDGSGSVDSDGQITRYEWDLDGNGSFETDTGATKTATKTYATDDTLAVRLRVTDDADKIGTAIRTLKLGDGAAVPYPEAVLGTTGLLHYWRLGEAAGTTLADLAGPSHATLSGGQLGAAGALASDPSTAVAFDGTDDMAAAQVDLSATGKATVEFWLKWNAFANDDDLAMELTSNFNQNDGGLLIDPNGDDGKFGVAIGRGASRNNAHFDRPSAGQWHHYAFVIDSGAAAAQQIVPYVDGQPVTYTKTASGTGAGNFANSTLFFMSRDGGLFGAGAMDEVAIYNGALSPAQITDHRSRGTNSAPTASFTSSPATLVTGQTASFDGAASTDPEGRLARYEWDLDGNGSFETDTGTTPRTTRSYATAGAVTVRLRVSDDVGYAHVATRSLTIGQNALPTASFTISPSFPLRNRTVTFNGSASRDTNGPITKWEWDLDGNGSFEVSETDAVTSRSYPTSGTRTIRLRVTDNSGATATASRSLRVF